MSIYMVTWKTLPNNGEHTEGYFMSDCEIDSAENAFKASEEWKKFVEAENPYRVGGDVLITGAFKLC